MAGDPIEEPPEVTTNSDREPDVPGASGQLSGNDSIVEVLIRASALSPRQEHAAQLKALGWSDTEIAEEIKVNRATVWRWRSHLGFRLRISQLQAEAADAAAGAFAETVRLSVSLIKEEVERRNWQAAALMLRLVGPEFVKAYVRQKPRDLDEMLAALGLERQLRADFASIVPTERRSGLLKHLEHMASTEAPEERRDRMLAIAATTTPELGRSRDPGIRELPAEELQQALEGLSERVSMLARARVFIGDEDKDWTLTPDKALEQVNRADDLVFNEENRIVTAPEAIAAARHLSRALVIVLRSVDAIVGAAHRDGVANAERLVESLQVDSSAESSGADLLRALRDLDIMIAEAAWAMGDPPAGSAR